MAEQEAVPRSPSVGRPARFLPGIVGFRESFTCEPAEHAFAPLRG